jgi:BioD-like phosphotransacetylase family protein
MLKIINNIIVATAKPEAVLRQMADRNLVITSGDREDLLKFLLKESKKRDGKGEFLCGFIITCGLTPSRAIRGLLEKSKIPTLLVEEDTYAIVTKLDEMIVKIMPKERDKINAIVELVQNNLDIDKLLSKI